MAKTNCVYKFNTAAGPVEIRGMAEMKAFLVANGVEAITGGARTAQKRPFSTRELGGDRTSFKSEDGKVVVTMGYADGAISHYLEAFDAPTGTGVATDLFLAGLEDYARRYPRAEFVSEQVMSDETVRMFERLTSAGMPFYFEDGSYRLNNFDLKGTDFGDVRAALAARYAPAFSKRQPEFVSQLATAIEGVPAKLATQPAKQWALWLDSNAAKLGVKKDEIEWSGIKDYLALRGSEKVTKADLGAYLAANGVQVEETVLGEPEPITRYVVFDERDRELASFDNEDDADRYASDRYVENDNRGRFRIEAIEEENFDAQGAKYDNYTLPGGENYREVLLTLPERRPLTDAWRKAQEAYGDDDQRTIDAKRAARSEAKGDKQYKSSHWQQPNVLAHIRLNDRTDADGKRVLFVEEIQSDWGQEGKKKGFKGKTQEDAKRFFGISDADWSKASTEERESYRLEMMDARGRDAIPSAPFVTKTEGWLNLALKRVAMMAVEGSKPGNKAWSDVTKPQRVREEFENYFGPEFASVLPLEVVDAAMLGATENNQIRRAVVESIPVDVVNILANNGISPEQLVREPNVIGKLLPVVSRAPVARGLADALALVGARSRAVLRGVLAGQVARSDREFDPAISARDFQPNVVVRLLTSSGSSQSGPGGLGARRAPAGDGAEASVAGLNNTRESRKLSSAELALALNRHESIVQGAEGDLVTKYIAPSGYEKVAFITGDQSAERYDLSKQVGAIEYYKNKDGKFHISATALGDNRASVLNGAYDASELPDVVGKEVAEKIVNSEGVEGEIFRPGHPDGSKLKTKVLRGLDLKVGGEGMKTFYDKLVPQALSKLLPKLGGGKLGEVTIVLNENLRAQVAPADAGTAEDDGRGFWLGSKGKAWENQPGFDVTDKMRETVEAGVPLFSKRQGDMVGQNFTVPATSKIDAARIVLQDDALRMKRVIEAVKAKGGVVGEQQNFYDALTLMPGRLQSAVEDFKNDVVKPMLKKAAEYDIDLDELALYAYAKHAKERNAYIAGINKRFPDGGSGMKNAEADQILADIRAGGKQRQYDDLHKRLMDISSTTRNLMLSEGLITQEEFDAMENAYGDYIPLRGFENVDEETGAIRPGIGRGVNIRGGETIRALGRASRAGDLIENVIRDYERVITRVEKNDVGKVLLDFVLSNPDPDLWGVDIERSKPTFNKAKGVVQYVKQVEKGEDTIGVKVGGQQVYIKLADKELTRALRQAWKDETSGLERFTMGMTGWWNNWMRAVLTKYNPVFAAINIPRDALWSGTAAALDALGPKGLKNYLMHYARAFAASARHETGLSGSTNSIFGNPVLDREFNQFRAAGGITGGFSMRTLQDINQDLRNELLLAGASPRTLWERVKSLPPFKLAKLTLRVLEFMGAASENATRFALYQAARETGKTVSDAAILAKDGTTNFNRKGEWGGALNNLYLFFNAAVQGNAQLLKVLKNRNVQASMAGVAGVGMMLALYGASAGGEDDDGEAYWDKIPSYIKERNIVIMLPPGEALAGGIERVGKRGRYLTIPVQYGFNVFPNIGYAVADILRNASDPKRGMTPTKAALHMASVVFGSVNPLGGAVDLSDGVQVLLAAMPTLADLPIQIITERGTFGTPSAPQPTSFDKKPDSERMFTNQQGSVSAAIAKTLNELGGGNEAKAGSVLGIETSVTPGTIQTIISATTGGLGTFGEQMLTAVNSMAGGEDDLKSNKIPFLNKFYGEVDEGANIGKASERSREIKKLVDEVKAQQEVALDPELTDEEQRLIDLANVQASYQKAMSRIRKEEIAIARDPDLTAAEKKLQRRMMQVERDSLATDLNREYLNALGE
jgi:hypothetical protein